MSLPVHCGPLSRTVFHGTCACFEEFDPRVQPINDDGYMGAGAYFTSEEHHAANYALMAEGMQGDQARVITVQLSLRKPYVLLPADRGSYGMDRAEVLQWTDRLIALGFDGAVNAAGTEFVAFHRHSIRILASTPLAQTTAA